jgi:hypothetical protein
MALEVKFFPSEIPPYLAAHGGLRALTPDEESIVYLFGEDLVRYIVQAWPVDTGTSQDAFSFYVSGDPAQGFGIVVENPMYYAQYVHLKGADPDAPLWRTLFPEAWASVKPGLLRALFAEIDATEAARAAGEAAKASKGASARRARSETSRELSGAASPFEALIKRLNPLA